MASDNPWSPNFWTPVAVACFLWAVVVTIWLSNIPETRIIYREREAGPGPRWEYIGHSTYRMKTTDGWLIAPQSGWGRFPIVEDEYVQVIKDPGHKLEKKR